MKAGFKLLLPLCLCASVVGVGCAQDVPAPQIATRQLVLPLQVPPQPTASVTAQRVGGSGGPATYYYWVVPQFTIGAGPISQPAQVGGVDVTLSSSAKVRVSWQAVTGADSYDVLRTVSATPPSGACGCAVTTGVTGLSTDDASNTLGAYTVATLNPDQFTCSVSTLPVSAGVAHTFLSCNGLAPVDLSLAGAATPGGADTQVQFNDGGVFGGIPESSYNKADHTLKFAYTYATPPIFMPFEIDVTWNNDSSPGDPALGVSSDIETSANTGGTFYGIQAFATVPNSAAFPAGGAFAIEANAIVDTVGKGPSSPTALHAVTTSSENGDFVWGVNSEVKGTRAGALADVAAVVGVVENGSSGATTLVRAFLARSASNTGGGTIANNYGVDIEDQHGVGTTNYALHIADQGMGAADFAALFAGGRVNIGAAGVTARLELGDHADFAPGGSAGTLNALLESQGNGTPPDWTTTPNIGTASGTSLNVTGSLKGATLNTATNCANAGGTCGSAASGSVTIAAAATTVTVATTAVTANSDILLTEDSSLGTKLGVTCNTTLTRTYAVTSRTAATSFVITSSVAPSVNPACLSYEIVN